MRVRNNFIILSRVARLTAMLAIVLSLLPANPVSAASSPAVSPAPAAARASNPAPRPASSNTALAGLWAAAVQPARDPDAAVITATKTDALQNDVPPAGPTAGDTIRYTTTIANSGSTEATGVTFADTIDSHTTLSGVAHVSPIAFDDSYDSIGNVGITVPSANGVLANDVDPDNNASLSVVPAAGGTAHGAFAIGSDGGFSYLSSAGYEGPDSFTYTLTDNDPLTPNDTGTVNITVNDVIWFIDNTAAGPGTGVMSNPFTSITGFNNVAADEAGDIIFVYQGVGSYPGAFTLLNQQQLIGQGVDLAAAAGLTVPPYSNALPGATANSLLTNLSGNAISLVTGNSNTIKGLTVGNTSGAAIYAPAGFGTLTVRNVAISGNGAALDLANGTLDAIFDNIASNAASAAGWAISLNGVGGSLAVSNPGAGTDTGITNAGYGGISIINAPAGASYNFGETGVGSSDIGVLLQGNIAGATTTFAILAITVSNGIGLTTNNAGVINIGGTASTISATNGSAMVVNGQANFGGGATFASVSSANGPTGVNLVMTGVTGSVTMNGGSITGSTAAGVAVSGGNADVTYAGSITNSTGRSASITSRSGGSVTLSGAINDTGSGILVQNNTGGSTTFSGSSKVVNTGASQAVTLSNNSGHTINFTNGGLAITTSSGTGFQANGGAAGVNVTGANNTINAGTGKAIDIASSNIGSSGITFRSVSSGASGNVGISLNSTGSLGGLTVTGDGATAGSGGTISGKTGNTDGVTLNNTKNASLAYMNINNNSRNGIYGTNLNGLTLTGVTLDGNADQFSPDEAGLLLEEVTGVVNISNTTVKNSYEHNVKVINSSGTLTAFNVTGGTIGPNPAGTGAQGLLFQGTGAANMTLSVNGTTFTGNQSNGIFADTAGGAMDVTIQNSTFLDNNVGPGVSVSSSGNMTFDILNNTAYSPLQVQSIGINVFANASHTGTFVGTIAGNTIGQIGSLASGSIDGNGIGVKNEGGGTLTVLIDDNDVYEVGNGSFTGFEGIWVINSVTAGTVNATVTNNTVDQIRDDRGLQVRQTIAGTTCADIRGNTFTNIGGSTDLRVSQTAGTYNLVQTSQANLGTVNNGATTTVSGAINFGASANCPIPTSAPESPAGHPDATATASNSSADQPRAAGRLSTSNLPIDQPSVPLLSAASPALAADQSTNLPIYQTPSGSRAPESGETVNVNIGTLPAGKSVTIVFDVIIDTPTTPQQIVSQVCNQGTVSATDLAPVLTDDPDVGGAADPTCTTMQPGSITIAKDQVPDGSTIFGFTSTIPGNTSFNVTGDTSLPINNVTPGSYTATENDPAPLFALTGLDCDDDASGVPSSGSTTTRTATINLEPGETITCTFTNTQQGVDLQVTKSDGGITAEPGDTIAYTLSYTNTGPIAASGVVLTETVPANTTFNPGASTAGWVCTPNGNAGSECTLAIGALAASGAGSATFAVDVDSPLPAQVTQIDNTVCIGDDGANGADQNPNDNCGDDSTPVTSGSITIVKATNPAGGTGFNFTGDLGPFSLDDGGQQPFTGLPSGDYDVTEVVPTNWSLTSVVCTGGDSTPITDGVTVNLDPGENITCTFTNTEHVDLQVTKSDDGVTAEPGDTVAYTLSYTNTGGDATGVVLTETVPANTTFNPGASTAGWICTPNGNAGSECTLAIGALAASGNGSATFAVDVDSPLPAQVTQIDNTVCIGDDGANGPDQNPNNNCGDDSTPVISGSITIVKATNPAGGTGFNFTGDLGPFSLDDGGQQPFTGLPSGDYDITEVASVGWLLAYVTCQGGGYTLTPGGVTVHLDPGENITCTFTNQQLPLVLELSKGVNGPTSVTMPGGSGQVSYTVAYTSTAVVTGTAVFTDTPSIDVGGVVCSDLTPATLGPGQSGSQVVDCAVTITPDLCVELTATLNNTVVADFSPLDGFGAGAPTVTITVPPSDPNNPLCNPQFSIVLTKTVGLDANSCASTDELALPVGGDDVTYCYTVLNTGNLTMTTHSLVDSELGTILSDFPYALSPGSSVFVTQTAFVDVTTVNIGTWTASNPPGGGLPPGEAMATDTATVTVVAPDPAIVLTKTVGLDANACATTDMITVPSGGVDVTYCYTVQNTGNITMTVHDLVDSELGTILSSFPYMLTPGASVFVTATTNIAVTTVNTATWTASSVNPTSVVSSTDSATVVVMPPTAVRLASLQAASGEADRTLALPMLLAAVLTAVGVLTWQRRRRRLVP